MSDFRGEDDTWNTFEKGKDLGQDIPRESENTLDTLNEGEM